MDDHGSSQGGTRWTLELHDQVVKLTGYPDQRCARTSRKDHLQTPVPAGYKRRSSLRCRDCEATVELGDVVRLETCWPLPGFESGAIATPGVAGPARWRSCAPSGLGCGEKDGMIFIRSSFMARPTARALRIHLPSLFGADQKWAPRSERANRTTPSVRSLHAVRPSWSRSISSAPARIEISSAASSRITIRSAAADPETTDDRCRRCAASSPVVDAATPLAMYARGLALHQACCL